MSEEGGFADGMFDSQDMDDLAMFGDVEESEADTKEAPEYTQTDEF